MANPQSPSAGTPTAPQRQDGLNVIALVSGGKDSFFSLLHCLANGHRVVALANLHPPSAVPPQDSPVTGTQGGGRSGDAGLTATAPGTTITAVLRPADHDAVSASGQAASCSASGIDREKPLSSETADPDLGARVDAEEEGDEEEDLNSFMYQTVGHQVIPLYAEATGIPLYRRPITGGAAQSGKDYAYSDYAAVASGATSQLTPLPPTSAANRTTGHEREVTRPAGTGAEAETEDETESMVPLLKAVIAAHPEANAISAGAILSTYQRTRVESVATRLGLTPLAYLWKFPVLPLPVDPNVAAATGARDPLADAQLLRDMEAVGLDARIIKVATGGLDESFLWTNLATAQGIGRVARGMRRFMVSEQGAVLGEGGEFETLVVDGPPSLFKKRIVIDEVDRHVVREGGHSTWLRICRAAVDEKAAQGAVSGGEQSPRQPTLLDPRFQDVQKGLASVEEDDEDARQRESAVPNPPDYDELPRLGAPSEPVKLHQWCVVGDPSARSSIESETISLVGKIRGLLAQASVKPSAIITTTIILRRMEDFPKINGIYGALFPGPNPPSRVTISCGGALPEGCSIVVFLTVHLGLRDGQRKGLHVQSRSYWAPANIGPYSQAISLPLDSLVPREPSSSSPGLVSIAGQIPLIPASMELPTPGPRSLESQITLSLQHLWRIGLDVGVQWWSSTVAFFPRAGPDPESMLSSVRLAAQAWHLAHQWPKESNSDQEDDDESGGEGPDLWDRRHNAAYISYGGDEEAKVPSLPDQSVLHAGTYRAQGKPVPPFFAAEVETLPRSAPVEWHAHLGFASLGDGSVQLWQSRPTKTPGLDVSYTTVRSLATGTTLICSVWSWKLGEAQRHCSQASTSGRRWPLEEARAWLASQDAQFPPRTQTPVVQYFDTDLFGMPAYVDGEEPSKAAPAVPCFSLWNARGERLAQVLVYQCVVQGSSASTPDEDDE